MQEEQNQQPGTPSNMPYNYTAGSGKKSHDGLRNVISTLSILVLAPIVAIGLTSFVFQSYEVDGPSMETTLQDQDRLIVWKVPRTISDITDEPYIPARGDIIVFNQSEGTELSAFNQKQLIKRVIALPGERVTVNNGEVTVFNDDNPRGFNPDITEDYSEKPLQTSGKIDLVVPEGDVFVLGDNRPNSLDSRVFGTIDSENIVGKLTFRVFPFNQIRSF